MRRIVYAYGQTGMEYQYLSELDRPTIHKDECITSKAAKHWPPKLNLTGAGLWWPVLGGALDFAGCAFVPHRLQPTAWKHIQLQRQCYSAISASECARGWQELLDVLRIRGGCRGRSI